MKIDNSYAANVVLGNNKSAARATTKEATGKSTSEVSLSGLVTNLSSSAAEGAPVNQSRVEELRQAIASGQFKINANAIADSLLATAQELVQSRQA